MNATEKRELVRHLMGMMQKSKLCLLAEYGGLSVADLTKLRRGLDKHDALFKVSKNRLTKIAVADDDNYRSLQEHLHGQIGITYFHGDLSQGLKMLLDFGKEHKNFKVKAAVMQGNQLTPAMLQEIASLPSKEVLLARIIGTIVAPHRQLVTVIQGVPRSLVTVLAAIRDKKQV